MFIELCEGTVAEKIAVSRWPGQQFFYGNSLIDIGFGFVGAEGKRDRVAFGYLRFRACM